MAPSPIHPMPRPLPSSSVIVADTVTSGKDFLTNFFSGFDPQKILPIAAFAATLGLGTAAFFLSQNRSDSDDGSSSSTSKKKSKSKGSKKRNKKSNRVVFQNPLEIGSVVGENENTDEDDSAEVDSKLSAIEKHLDEEEQKSEMPMIIEENNNEIIEPEIRTNENALILKQCPRGRRTPCIAPFPLKLETFLRVYKINYKLDFNDHEPRIYGSPWIRINTEDVTESQNVHPYLIEQYNIKAEKELTPEQRSIATAYSHLLENHLYWALALWRWVYDGARSLKDIQLLPKKTQVLIPDVCKTVEQAAWFHGIGKLSPTEVRNAVVMDLQSLSEFLGTKDYFLNTPTPTELDCTAFGMLAQFLWNMEGPFHDAIIYDYKNLRDFCWRIRLNYWPDWDACLDNTQFYTDEPYPAADSINYPY